MEEQIKRAAARKILEEIPSIYEKDSGLFQKLEQALAKKLAYYTLLDLLFFVRSGKK